HGAQLSGGQRQRIAVARALIKNAPIILLDEATAALDSESEKQVQEAIEHLCQNRTTIVIAHRLHTIMHADAILVVEGGEIVERGRHDDLLRRGGRYASFFRLQQASRKKERPWEIGKSFDHSAPCGALQPAAKIGHPSKGKIWLSVNGTERQKGDLTELIWSVPEIIWQLSQQVEIGAGDIIMTGTPAGVAALSPGDKVEC